MGNPHFVVFAEPGVDLLPDLTEWGPSLESAPVFPERSNIEWVQFEAPDRLRVRVWERGVGETQACGSGACAVAVAARASARSDKDTMTVLLPGGALRVHWAGTQEEPVSLEGPARTVFHGSWRLDS